MEMKQDKQQRERDQFNDGNHPILMQFINEEEEEEQKGKERKDVDFNVENLAGKIQTNTQTILTQRKR